MKAPGGAAASVNRVDPAPASVISLTPPSAQFDGVFYVGATTASPPARSEIEGDAPARH